MRAILRRLDKVDRVHLQGELSGPLDGTDALAAAGVRVVTRAGRRSQRHFDNPDSFVRAVAGGA
ncbi:hypothetical protein ABZY42_14800 [Streptomyces sp. NPDC006622]|uniref:hypothetical protein n=1 Tax=Streptomyces sp. NPDC006622 TaxID=3155459 RepID=UPI0033B48114